MGKTKVDLLLLIRPQAVVPDPDAMIGVHGFFEDANGQFIQIPIAGGGLLAPGKIIKDAHGPVQVIHVIAFEQIESRLEEEQIEIDKLVIHIEVDIVIILQVIEYIAQTSGAIAKKGALYTL